MRRSNYEIYRIISSISYIVRFWLCYLTIENVPIFSNELVAYFIGQIISIYFLLMVICYFIVGRLSYKLGSNDPSARSILYFLLYIAMVFILWIVLKLLVVLGVLPI